MKRLILLFIIFKIYGWAQSSNFTLLMGDEGYKNTETTLYLASLTTPLSSTQATRIDDFYFNA